LKKLNSISQLEAAEYLDCTDRTIRSRIDDKRLDKSKKGRVICNDKLLTELRKQHGPSYH